MQLQLASEKEEMFIVHGYTGLGLAGEAVKKDIVPYLFSINSLLKDRIFKAAFILIENFAQRHLRESFELV